MSGGIVDLSRTRAPARLDVDVAVVGSGPAGATTARELARRGMEVAVFEEGGDYTGLALTQRDGEMYDQLYMDRGGRSTSDLGVSVLQGRALGGGAVINQCDVVPIRDSVLRLWSRRHGLREMTPDAMGVHRDRALEDLHASLPAEDRLNENNRLLRRGAEALGWRGEVMMHNRVGCAGLGACMLGCPLDAKRNPRFVALPAALERGARIYTRARVVRIAGANDERKTLEVRSLDPRGYHEKGSLSVRARTVVVAASAVSSAELLLRSGLGNEHVGRGLMLQPQLPITARFDAPVRAFRGIPQAFAVTEFEEDEHPEHGWWGFRIEAIGGTPGIVASIVPSVGLAGKRWMHDFPFVASALLLLPDAPQGRIEVESSGRLRVHYALTDEQRQRFARAVEAGAKAYLAAGARWVMIPTTPPVVIRSTRDLGRARDVPLRPASAPLISAHQQGTVRMAPSAREGAADPDGRVYGTSGIYCFDSSVFPSSASSHTMAPIITVSHFLAHRLAERLSR